MPTTWSTTRSTQSSARHFVDCSTHLPKQSCDRVPSPQDQRAIRPPARCASNATQNAEPAPQPANFTGKDTHKNLNNVFVFNDADVCRQYRIEVEQLRRGSFGRGLHGEVPKTYNVGGVPVKVLFAPDHTPELEFMKQMLKVRESSSETPGLPFSPSSAPPASTTRCSRSPAAGVRIRGDPICGLGVEEILSLGIFANLCSMSLMRRPGMTRLFSNPLALVGVRLAPSITVIARENTNARTCSRRRGWAQPLLRRGARNRARSGLAIAVLAGQAARVSQGGPLILLLVVINT